MVAFFTLGSRCDGPHLKTFVPKLQWGQNPLVLFNNYA
jgi:hypothetical protein